MLVVCTNHTLAGQSKVSSLPRAANYLCLNKKAKSKNTCACKQAKHCPSIPTPANHHQQDLNAHLRPWMLSTAAGPGLEPNEVTEAGGHSYGEEDGQCTASSRAVGLPTGEQTGSIASCWGCTGAVWPSIPSKRTLGASSSTALY